MERPYIFCHMMTSLDGKIMGNYMTTKNSEKAGEVFYNIAFGEHPYYEHRGWLSGRVTTDDNFTFYKKPKLDESAPKVPEGDYIVTPDLPMYYVSVDPSGKLGWESNEVIYQDTKAHVLEVLTEKASNAYKAFLRKRGDFLYHLWKRRTGLRAGFEKNKRNIWNQDIDAWRRGSTELVVYPGRHVR